jgi:hypothetical protein
MLRFVFQYLLPLLLPFLVYLAWVALSRGPAPGWLRAAPWPHLAGAGVLLLAVSLIAWSLLSGAPPEADYVPPHLENGEIVPGHTVAPR